MFLKNTFYRNQNSSVFYLAISDQYFLVGDVTCDKHTVVYWYVGDLSRGLDLALVRQHVCLLDMVVAERKSLCECVDNYNIINRATQPTPGCTALLRLRRSRGGWVLYSSPAIYTGRHRMSRSLRMSFV